MVSIRKWKKKILSVINKKNSLIANFVNINKVNDFISSNKINTINNSNFFPNLVAVVVIRVLV